MPRTTPAHRVAAAVTVAAVATAGLALAAPLAQAGGYSVAYTDGDGVALRSAPQAGARLSPLVVWRDGTPLSIICQTWSSDAVGPRANHIFDRVANPGRAAATWVPDAYVAGTANANQFTAGIPRCDGSPAPAPSSAADRAIGWMSARAGSRELDGQCLAAVYRAYLSAGRDITAGLPQAQARGTAYSYWTVAANRHPGDRNPPRGALVFFRPAHAGGAGHVALSLGNGQMITTWDGRTPGIHTMAISAYQSNLYLGWVGV